VGSGEAGVAAGTCSCCAQADALLGRKLEDPGDKLGRTSFQAPCRALDISGYDACCVVCNFVVLCNEFSLSLVLWKLSLIESCMSHGLLLLP
jgi:hypothetical protein